MASTEEANQMKLTSPEFKHNQQIPKKFTCKGANINPQLKIEQLPPGTKSLVLIVDDPDAPGKTFVHWVLYDIPPTASIFENSHPGTQGMNDYRVNAYRGPCPPSGVHRYFFKIYALDTLLDLPEGKNKAQIEHAMEGHILGKDELIGVFPSS